MLRDTGAKVTPVESAAAAFEAFTLSRPDILISDIGMPEEDGNSFMRRIRAAESKAKTTPVRALALTAYAVVIPPCILS